jgi:hypothetical protein
MTVQENRAEALKLVDKYTQALDSTLSFIDHYEQSTEFGYRVAGGRQDKGKNFKRGQVRHDDQRIYKQEYKWGRSGRHDYHENMPDYGCSITDAKAKLSYWHDRWINGPSNDPGAVSRGLWGRPIKVNLSRSLGVSYIVGYVGSDERLDAILRKASRISVREATENVGGSECFVIDADTKCGQYTVWLDPDHGYHPARVRREAGRGDYTHGRLMSEGETALTYLDTVRFEKIDDVWVPMEANAGCDRRMPSGDFVKEDYHYKRTHIVLNPDHDKLGSFADPILEDPSNDPALVNGTRVEIDIDDRSKEYTWQDGKLVDDNAMVVDMDGLRARFEANKRLLK